MAIADIPAEHILHVQSFLGEGSLWEPVKQKLYWVDIEGKIVHMYDPVTKEHNQVSTGEKVGTVVPMPNGNVVVALKNGIHELNPETGELKLIVNPLKDIMGRFNDGKCDPGGRFWVGTIVPDGSEPTAVLFRLDRDKSIRQVLDGVTNSNGITWSLDKKTMYYIDTPTRKIQAFDYDNETGDITNRRIAVQVPDGVGFPDGMTIDSEGKLWVALWGKGIVARFDPDSGEMLQKILVPAPHTSSCAFGGKDLKTLYITTAQENMTAEKLKQFPLSGDIFAATPGVAGVEACFYKGDPA